VCWSRLNRATGRSILSASPGSFSVSRFPAIFFFLIFSWAHHTNKKKKARKKKKKKKRKKKEPNVIQKKRKEGKETVKGRGGEEKVREWQIGTGQQQQPLQIKIKKNLK
jgi:hypothetical protein